ncbi:hypothetical protein DFH29DRAFT_197959 [Suillus ampliporus]|nr:hypothetical protein DFH29DRAFT_197959 [Suillus ampliporus]
MISRIISARLSKTTLTSKPFPNPYVNDPVPDTIDTHVLNKPSSRKPLNAFHTTENNNIVIASAWSFRCFVVNMGSRRGGSTIRLIADRPTRFSRPPRHYNIYILNCTGYARMAKLQLLLSTSLP